MTVRQVLTALICAVAFCTLPAAVASAEPLGVAGVFGSTGTGDGQFQEIAGVAVNNASGDVYVVDVGGERVERFNAAGEFQDAFGTAGSGNGAFDFEGGVASSSSQIAVDQVDGSVYVADPGNNRVQKFTAAGVFQLRIGTADGSAGDANGEFSRPQGVAVDPNDQSVYVSDTGNYRVQKFTSTGSYVLQFGSKGAVDGPDVDPDGQFSAGYGPGQLGVDSVGRVWVLDPGTNYRLARFTSAGVVDGSFARGFDNLSARALAVDPVNDHVYVGRSSIIEYDANGDLVEVHGSNVLGGESVTGAAVKNGALAYVAAKDGYGGSLTDRVFRMGAVTPPTVTMSASTDITGHAATLHGVINPNGGPAAKYHFEASEDFGSTWSPVSGDIDIGDGTTDVAVTNTVENLKPNFFYAFQLVATKAYNGQVVSASDYIQTLTVVPTITNTRTDAPSEHGVRFRASINPEGVDATYQFQYGTTTSYGSTFPLIPADIPAGRDPVELAKTIGGLEPGTTYHYRLVATNTAGSSQSPDQTFTTATGTATPVADNCPNAEIRKLQHAERLGDCRAYEQVSPRDKRGNPIDNRIMPVRISPTGDVVAYSSNGAFAGAETSFLYSYYMGRRTAGGWSVDAIEPAQLNDTDLSAYSTLGLTPGLEKAAQVSTRALTPGAIEGGVNFYLRDNATGQRTLAYAAPQAVAAALLEDVRSFFPDRRTFAVSADGSHILFQSSVKLTDNAIAGQSNAYELVGGGIRLVSVMADGTSDPGGGQALSLSPKFRAMSADGRRIYFLSPSLSGSLYLREDGERTIPVSVSRRPGDPTTPVNVAVYSGFAGISSDGVKAFFYSAVPLTSDAADGADNLYEYDADSDSLTNLTAGNQDQTLGSGAFGTVINYADDGSSVYFVGQRVLAQGAARGAYNLYASYQGSVQFIAQTDGISDIPSATSVSPNGRYFAYETGLHDEVYVYDRETQTRSCVSCSPIDGVHGDSVLPNRGHTVATQPTLDDGRLVFTTTERLVPEDVNGKQDVYLWDDGRAELISPGTGTEGARFGNVSPDGREVFFVTADGLVAQDTDGLPDLYVARIDGGLPGQQERPGAGGGCVGDVCQGSLGSHTPAAGPGSAQSVEVAKPLGRARIASLTASQRRRLVRSGRGSVLVSVSAAGTARLAGTAMIGGKRTTVLRASARFVKPGSKRVVVVLSRLARRQLLRGRSLAVVLRVSMDGRPSTGSTMIKLGGGR